MYVPQSSHLHKQKHPPSAPRMRHKHQQQTGRTHSKDVGAFDHIASVLSVNVISSDDNG